MSERDDVFYPTKEFPKLMWTPDGKEVRVESCEEQEAKLAEGYRLTADASVPAHEVPPAEPVTNPSPPAPVRDVPDVDPENEPATFGASDDDTHGDDEQLEDGKAKKGGKKK